MDKEITLTFHNQGIRSYIEVDLCLECPRQDNKGCCGYYSPIFYPTDLAYLLINKPDLIDYIFSLDDITILDTSVTVNNSIDGDSYRCRFHTLENGCYLAQNFRETICRHFVCPGINWQEEIELKLWKDFFDQLFDYEIKLNNKISEILVSQGLTLRNPSLRENFFKELLIIYKKELNCLPNFIRQVPDKETKTIKRSIEYGNKWPL